MRQQPNIIDMVLAQPAEGDWKLTATFKARQKVIGRLDRAALVGLEAIMMEYPNITTGDMHFVLTNALWWLDEVGSDAMARKQGGDTQ